MKRYRISSHPVFSGRSSESWNCYLLVILIFTCIKRSSLWSSCGHPFLSPSGLSFCFIKVFKSPCWCCSFILSVFFFKSKWKLLFRRIDCFYLQNGEVPLRPKVWMQPKKKKIAFMSKTNNEWQNPHSKLRSSIRLVISFFSSLIDFLFWF